MGLLLQCCIYNQRYSWYRAVTGLCSDTEEAGFALLKLGCWPASVYWDLNSHLLEKARLSGQESHIPAQFMGKLQLPYSHIPQRRGIIKLHHWALCLLRDHQIMFESHRVLAHFAVLTLTSENKRKYRARGTSKQIFYHNLQHRELQSLISYFYYQCKSQTTQNKVRHAKITVYTLHRIKMIEPRFQQPH